MKTVFRRSFKGPAGPDGAASYRVIMERRATVAEFIAQALEYRHEWGSITVHMEGSKDQHINFRYGTSDVDPDARYMQVKVKKARANGGMSRMDYIVEI